MAYVVLAVLPARPAFAVDPPQAQIPSSLVRLTEHARAQIRLITYHNVRANMDGADIASWYPIIRPAVRVPFAKWGEIDVATRYDVIDYEFGGSSRLLTGRLEEGTPINDLHNVAIRVGTNLELHEKVFFSTAGFTRSRFETGASAKRALRVGGFAGFGVQVLPELFIGAGVGGVRRAIDGHWRIAPIWQARIRLTERIEFRLRNFNGRVRLELDDRFALSVIGRIGRRSYRLKNRPGETASSFREQAIPVIFRLVHRPSKRLRVDYDFGIRFDQKYSTRVDGKRYTVDQARLYYIGLGIRLRR